MEIYLPFFQLKHQNVFMEMENICSFCLALQETVGLEDGLASFVSLTKILFALASRQPVAHT